MTETYRPIRLKQKIHDGAQDAFNFLESPYKVINQEGEQPGSLETIIYITEEVLEPALFTEVIATLDAAKQQDLVVLKLVTPGGRLDSCLMMIDAINQCEATVVAELSGVVASAGTMITMACDGVYMAPHCEFMCHYYSGGSYGKGNELWESIKFQSRNMKSFYYDIYKDFFTPKEIKRMINGHDFYLNKEQFDERWDRVMDARQKLLEQEAEVEEAQQLEEVLDYVQSLGYNVEPPKKKKKAKK